MISASFLIIYPFAGELYPTEIRGVGIGFSSYVGGIGLIIIPFVTYLVRLSSYSSYKFRLIFYFVFILKGRENLVLPLIIMGFLIMFGGITGLRLPETLNQKLPATLAEGELFGKDWKKVDLQNSGKSADRRISFEETADQITHTKRINRQSMKRLIRQASVMDTQKTRDGAMQLTYWF